ncbi:MAG: DUF308 domain-containing protein [Candidatus Dormibacteraeota bacterium]|nr:DUF308 domain-containing protein [Candidatus Dormibacteraeota bacterium]MBO0760776.1 DUF308 domain-containing protein [Candidatus Dormibacteraeota bacterium]
MERRRAGWPLLLAWGVIAIVAGIVMLVQPARTAALLLTIVALLWLVSGVFDLVTGLRRQQQQKLRLARGAISVAAAIVVLLNSVFGGFLPSTVQFWILVVAAAVNGGSHLVTAVARRGGSRAGLTLGITQLAIAAALALSMLVTVVSLFVVLGAELVVIGLILFAVALWLRSRRPAIPTG